MRRLAWILPHLFRPSLKDTITRLLRVQDGVYATWSGLLLQEPGGRSNCNRPLCKLAPAGLAKRAGVNHRVRLRQRAKFCRSRASCTKFIRRISLSVKGGYADRILMALRLVLIRAAVLAFWGPCVFRQHTRVDVR